MLKLSRRLFNTKIIEKFLGKVNIDTKSHDILFTEPTENTCIISKLKAQVAILVPSMDSDTIIKLRNAIINDKMIHQLFINDFIKIIEKKSSILYDLDLRTIVSIIKILKYYEQSDLIINTNLSHTILKNSEIFLMTLVHDSSDIFEDDLMYILNELKIVNNWPCISYILIFIAEKDLNISYASIKNIINLLDRKNAKIYEIDNLSIQFCLTKKIFPFYITVLSNKKDEISPDTITSFYMLLNIMKTYKVYDKYLVNLIINKVKNYVICEDVSIKDKIDTVEMIINFAFHTHLYSINIKDFLYNTDNYLCPNIVEGISEIHTKLLLFTLMNIQFREYYDLILENSVIHNTDVKAIKTKTVEMERLNAMNKFIGSISPYIKEVEYDFTLIRKFILFKTIFGDVIDKTTLSYIEKYIIKFEATKNAAMNKAKSYNNEISFFLYKYFSKKPDHNIEREKIVGNHFVDFIVTSKITGQKYILEIDGPIHFINNSEIDIATISRNLNLLFTGYKVISINADILENLNYSNDLEPMLDELFNEKRDELALMLY